MPRFRIFKRIIFISLFVVCTQTISAQGVEKYTIKLDFAPFNNIHSQSNNEFDYLDFIDEYDSVFFDDANLNISTHLWFSKAFELDIEFGMQPDLVPRHFDFRATFTKHAVDWNIGFSNKLFFLYELEKGFDDSFQFSYADQDWYQFYYTNFGPYIGIRKNYEGHRLNISAHFNTGIYFNNTPATEKIILKEKTSNLVIQEQHHLKVTPSVWIQPELITQFDLIKTNKYDFGISFEINYYLTQQQLKYDLVHYEWTIHNKTEYKAAISKHTVQRFDVGIGVYLRNKKSQH